ncbi:MAG TPA: hypothetical protein VMX75_06225, partial [Spirochaetia bacterium]|nr:hypothetical protein [Spirochaetia bacterium]
QRSLNAMAQVSYQTDRFLTDLLSLDAKAFYKLARMTFDNPPSDPSIHTLHSLRQGSSVCLLLKPARAFFILSIAQLTFTTVNHEWKRKE